MTSEGRYLARRSLIAYIALERSLREWRAEWDAGVVKIRLSDGQAMFMDDAVPDTRGDCPIVKPCPHVRCRYHLWRIDGGEDGTRAGRPGLSAVPRDSRGLTIRTPGELDGSRPGTTLEARWLETPVPPSCALDESERTHTNEEVGYRVNRHRTLAARDVTKGIRHGVVNAKGMGMNKDDFLAGIRAAKEE